MTANPELAVSSEDLTNPAKERKLSLVGHLDELRRRIWMCVIAIGVCALLNFSWADWLIDWLMRPAGTSLPKLAFFSPPEAMMAYFKVAIASALILCMPFLLYELWAFIKPALTQNERRYGLAFVWWGSVLFLCGVAFSYWLLLPVTLRFLLEFGAQKLVPVISVNNYLSFITMVMMVCGLIFELPLAVFFLTKMGVLGPSFLRRNWGNSLLVMVIAAAIITPTTDAATLLLLVVPMLALYEVSIWVAALASK